MTPGGFNIQASYNAGGYPDGFEQAFALYFFAWTIFIFFLLLGTVKTNVAYFSLFLMLDLTFLFLACAYQNSDSQNTKPNTGLLRAGGAFGALTAFISWYNAMAGLLDSSNRYVFDTTFPIQYAYYHVVSSLFPCSSFPGQLRKSNRKSSQPHQTEQAAKRELIGSLIGASSWIASSRRPSLDLTQLAFRRSTERRKEEQLNPNKLIKADAMVRTPESVPQETYQ